MSQSPPKKYKRKMMLFANNGGVNSRTALLDGAPFKAQLTKSLVLNAGTGSPTYTRATTATFTDFEGVLRTAIAGEARFVGARRVRNLIAGSSENLTTAPWALIGTASRTATTVTTTNNGDGIQQGGIGASTPRKLVGSFLISGTQGNTINAFVLDATGTIYGSRQITLTPTPTRYSVVQSSNETSAGSYIQFRNDAVFGLGAATQAQTFTVTQIQVENVVGQSVQTAGEYVSVGVLSAPYHGAGVDGVKYFDVDLSGNAIPTATLKGYLAEGARTNLCLQSQTVDNASWTKDGGTIAADQVVSPDGTTTADKFTLTATTGRHRVFQAPATAAASTACSVYAKAGTVGWLSISDGGGAQAYAKFNISTGTAGATGGTRYLSSSISSVGNGWYRCELVFTAQSSNTINIAIADTEAHVTDANTTWAAAGTETAYLWGAQVEVGSFASTYIPTTTVAVTRNADVLTYPSAGNVSGTSGWAYAEVNISAPSVATNLILGAVAGNQALMYRKSTGVLADYDGVNEVTGGAVSSSAQHKVASTWTGASEKLVVDGGAVTSGTFDGDFNFAGTLYVGRSTAGDELFGTIRNVRISTQALSAAQLAAITT